METQKTKALTKHDYSEHGIKWPGGSFWNERTAEDAELANTDKQYMK